jgi:hypothetical protein
VAAQAVVRTVRGDLDPGQLRPADHTAIGKTGAWLQYGPVLAIAFVSRDGRAS